MKKLIEIEIEVPERLPDFKKLWRDFKDLHKKMGKIPDWGVQRKQIERLISEQLK